MNELISVIIPAYNSEKYIEKCINSLINQTYRNIEIIIVNDGSTDSTKQIIDNFKEKDQRIRIIHKSNTGVSDTRNRGFEIAKGNYISFVDSDDEVKQNFCHILISLIKNHNADIAHCGFELIKHNFSKVFYGTNNLYIHSRKEALVELLKANLFEPSSCTKLYKREILERIKFEKKIKFNEDLLFNVKAFKNARKIVFHDISLYIYTYNPSSASRNSQNYTIQESVLQVTQIIDDELSGLDINHIKNQFYVNKLISIYKALFSENLQYTSLGKNVKTLLKKSSNRYLDFRMLYLKFSLLYFYKLYNLTQLVYDKTFGKNKKWDITN